MKRLISVTVLGMMTLLAAMAQDCDVEICNIVSEETTESVQDVPVVRRINGGTVIIPEFDASCPEEIKGPFSYACKILEDYMQPCMPLRVKVSCGRVNNSGEGPTLSKVTYLCKENFGASTRYRNVPMSTIKGVILDERCFGVSRTYMAHVPSLDFLIEKPDITVVYNSERLDEFSFSLDATPEGKYDFVSVALRDLVRGLGFSTSFRYNPQTKGLDYPRQELLPFECVVKQYLGNEDDPQARLAAATRGELELKQANQQKGLRIYAPSVWQKGLSLNYFIPDSTIAITNILSYNFGKGTVARSLHDNYSASIFYYLLGWRGDRITMSGGVSTSYRGSTAVKVPYMGSLSLDTVPMTMSGRYVPPPERVQPGDPSDTIPPVDMTPLYDYVASFHPFQVPEGATTSQEGTSVSVLKNDGKWDLVCFLPFYIEPLVLDMTEWTFNCPDEEYARTADGYLKARVTVSKRDIYGGYNYESTFMVLDYLPQRINLSYSRPVQAAATISDDEEGIQPMAVERKPVRIYFSNLEGIDRIILERLREGTRLPSKLVVNDFRKGYTDLTIDRNTTFTAIGYNANGSTRSLPITIAYDDTPEISEASFLMSPTSISVRFGDGKDEEFDYTVTSLEANPVENTLSGRASEHIDISGLEDGMYVLTVSPVTGKGSSSFKFKK